MLKKILTITPIALGASLMIATPANAAKYDNGNSVRAEIRQLDRQINNVRGLSHREEARLSRKVDNLQALQRRYARNGFSRVELRNLNRQVTAIKYEIRTQAKDRNDSNKRRR